MNFVKLYKLSLLSAATLLLIACSPSDKSSELNSYPAYGFCTIDVPANNSVVDSKQDFHLGGWAFNRQDNSVPDAVIVYFVNEETTELTTRTATRAPREDVAAAFGEKSVLNSGFNALILQNSLKPGRYRIELIQVSNRNGSFRCDGEKHAITVQ